MVPEYVKILVLFILDDITIQNNPNILLKQLP